MVAKMFRCLFMIAAVSLAGLSGCMESQKAVPDQTAGIASPTVDGTDVNPTPYKATKAGTIDGDPTADFGGGGDCCDGGYYQCPTNGQIFEYEALSCGFNVVKKTTAAQRCDAACVAACVDSGWLGC